MATSCPCSAAASTSARTPRACSSPRPSDGRLAEVLQRRAFTRIGKGLAPGAEIPRAKIEEVAAVVASHRELAEPAGADPVRTVATAAIRSASNRDEFVDGRRARRRGGLRPRRRGGGPARLPRAPRARSGSRLEGRSASSTSAAAPRDRGRHGRGRRRRGGPRSGSAPATWPTRTCARTRRRPPSSPRCARTRPRRSTLSRRRARRGRRGRRQRRVAARASSAPCSAPRRRRALGVLRRGAGGQVAARSRSTPSGSACCPAGMLILDAAARRLGCPLVIGCGGLREGVLLELAEAA